MPACPAFDAVTDADLKRLGRLQGLACFGAREVTFEATVTCHSVIADGGPGGVEWKDSGRVCFTRTEGDSGIGLFGAPITRFVTGGLGGTNVVMRARVTGHFDDPLAVRCWNLPIGISLDSPGRPDPDAVIDCRQMFVVTEAPASTEGCPPALGSPCRVVSPRHQVATRASRTGSHEPIRFGVMSARQRCGPKGADSAASARPCFQ